MTTKTKATNATKTAEQFLIIADTGEIVGRQPEHHLAYMFALGFSSSRDCPMPMIAKVVEPAV